MPRAVEIELPAVSTLTAQFVVAVHFHHTDLPPAAAAWSGSPDSLVAPTLEAVTLLVSRGRFARFTKLSLAGAPMMTPANNKEMAAMERSLGFTGSELVGSDSHWQLLIRQPNS